MFPFMKSVGLSKKSMRWHITLMQMMFPMLKQNFENKDSSFDNVYPMYNHLLQSSTRLNPFEKSGEQYMKKGTAISINTKKVAMVMSLHFEMDHADFLGLEANNLNAILNILMLWTRIFIHNARLTKSVF
jgi:hypothetical protein